MVQKEKRRFSLVGRSPKTPKNSKDATSPSNEELTASQLHSSSSPPEATQSTGNTTQWDMTAIQQKRSSDNNDKPRRALSDGESPRKPRMRSAMKAQAVASSAGTTRLNRILHQPSEYRVSYVPSDDNQDDEYEPNRFIQKETLKDVKNPNQVGRYVAKVVTPPIAVDSRSIGGTLAKKVELVQECLLCMPCKNFEMTGERISPAALEDPSGYGKHKRSLGYGATPGKGRDKLRYICLVRATNRPLLKEKTKKSISAAIEQATHDTSSQQDEQDEEVDAYDVMFGDEQGSNIDEDEDEKDIQAYDDENDPEISSFPILVCVTFSTDGTNPDIKRLTPLDQLTTVQNASTGSVIQLVFNEGDSVTIDFASLEEDTPAAGLRKERFTWSLLQIHAILCMSVVERNSLETTASKMLPPLNVRNLDRAELQYIATVNGFLRDSPTLCALLDRQRDVGPEGNEDGDEGKEEMDGMAYDMMMGNFSTRVAIFHSVDERVDAEEVLNGDQFRELEEAEEVSLLLQRRMHDLEAETCRRLIAWEDEKHYNLIGQSSLFNTMAQRDTVDALSLASLFTTLKTLDAELKDMEAWLMERAAVIQPLTDDCRDIEEENRQLEQQWKSYDMLGTELSRLLNGVDVAKELERVLKNPASALVYRDSGTINVKASERGVDKIHEAGQALKQAMDNASKAGGVHLRAVSERVEGLTATSNKFCTALAQIVVTVMEELKTEVVAGSDGGKVSKSDTHSMIAKKIRDVSRLPFDVSFSESGISHLNIPFFLPKDATQVSVGAFSIHEFD